MKKSIISGVLALTVFFGVGQTIATPVAHAQNISIQQLIQLFISLGIIPSDKVAMVEAAFGMANTTTPTTNTTSTIITTPQTITTNSSNPTITYLSKTSALVGSSVTIYGSGFDNLSFVVLGGLDKQGVAFVSATPTSVSSTSLTFTVPSVSTDPTVGIVSLSGNYTVQVGEEIKGTDLSNSVNLTVTHNINTPSSNVNPTITSNVQTASGNTALLTMTVPSNTVQAELYLSCPTGVSASNASGDTAQLCNTYKPMYFILPSGNVASINVFFTNTTSNTLTVAANFEVYTSDNPSYEKMVSTSINVPPASTTKTTSVTFTASPTSGVSPLQVTFTGMIDSKAYGPGPFTIDFGDGLQKSFPMIGLIGNVGNSQNTITPEVYTYSSPGIYTAKLSNDNCAGSGTGRLQQPSCSPGNAISTVTITVN